MKVELTVEERVAIADLAISEILERYQVEFCGDCECDLWLEPIEEQPPKLKIV